MAKQNLLEPDPILPFLSMKTEAVVADIVQDVRGKNENVVNRTSTLDYVYGAQRRTGTKRSRKERSTVGGKDRVSKIPPCEPGKRSSIYRGVTRHRWTGRYEAHLWDKSTWNVTQKKKGKQVYLGAYDAEESAARAYDLAALKYWGCTTLTNFPVTDYAKDVEEMQQVTKEEYLASLRRKSSGFSRGVSKYRGVARHHHNGRWEARIGRVFGNKYLYLGTYSTQEEAAAAYDMAAIEYRGLNAITNFDLSRYVRWLRPPNNRVCPGTDSGDAIHEKDNLRPPSMATQSHDRHDNRANPTAFDFHSTNRDFPPQKWSLDSDYFSQVSTNKQLKTSDYPGAHHEPSMPSFNLMQQKSSSPTALSLLLQSTLFRQMLEKVSVGRHPSDHSEASLENASVSEHVDDHLNCKNFFQAYDHLRQKQVEDRIQSPVVLLGTTTHYSPAGEDTDHSRLYNETEGSNGSSYNLFQTFDQSMQDAHTSSAFDSYTRISPHYTPNLNKVITDDETAGMPDQDANAELWSTSSLGAGMNNDAVPSPSTVAIRKCFGH